MTMIGIAFWLPSYPAPLLRLYIIFLLLSQTLSSPSSSNHSCESDRTMATSKDSSEPTRSAVTLALAKKESAEHMQGTAELYAEMRKRPLIIKAYALDDPNRPPAGDNVKTVHFVRHGQGFHNLMADLYKEQGREWTQFQPENNPYMMSEIEDPPLTEKGRREAYHLKQKVVETMPTENLPKLVVVSPLCRAMQTGLMAFEKLVGSVPFVAHEMAREEHGAHFCDRRRSVSRQKQEFPQIDFSLLENDDDTLFQESKRESRMEVGERVFRFMEWLSTRQEDSVAIASHSGWLLTVFNGILECDENLKEWFHTGEMRTVVLEFVKA